MVMQKEVVQVVHGGMGMDLVLRVDYLVYGSRSWLLSVGICDVFR